MYVVRMIFQPGQVLFVNQGPGYRLYDQFRSDVTLSKAKASFIQRDACRQSVIGCSLVGLDLSAAL